MAVYCKSCGRPLQPGARWCHFCGARAQTTGTGIAQFDEATGHAKYHCGDCRRCKHRASCVTKAAHWRRDGRGEDYRPRAR